MPSSRLNLHAALAASFDQPFELLHACHERVQRSLCLLLRVAEHLPVHGADEEAAQAARDLLRYFDVAGPAHHEDEERQIFPMLLRHGGAEMQATVHRLQQEHVALTQQWQAVRTDLLSVADLQWRTPQLAAALPRWLDFSALYERHIALENARVYPAAQALLDTSAMRSMGQEMARRRSVAAPQSGLAA